MLGDAYETTVPVDYRFLALKPIDKGFAFGAPSYLTGECPPVACARGPQLSDCSDDAASRCWWSVSVGIDCRACLSIPRDIRTQDFEFLVVLTILVVQSPMFLQA